MIVFKNTLLVFKEDSIYQFEFTTAGLPQVTQVNAAVGAIAPRSIMAVENDIFFASRRGVFTIGNEPGFAFDVLRTNELSARVRSVFQSLESDYLKNIAAIYATKANSNLVIFSYTPSGQAKNSGNKIKKMTREEITNYIRNTNPKIRETAYKTILAKYSENKGVIGEIYQNIVLNWKDEGIQIRGYKSPISIRNIGNDVDDKTIESLLTVCRKNSPIFQKFFIQKAKMLKMKKLRRYDLYAPAEAQIKEKNYQYDKSVKLVFESLRRFSPKLEEFAKKVFDEKHVDSSIRVGKRDGAFCPDHGGTRE